MNKKLLQSLELLSFIALPLQGRVRRLYDLLDENNSLCNDKEYLNLGYWAKGATNLDLAAEHMVDLMAERASIKWTDNVLDVGFGYGDQDFHLFTKYQPQSITGVNLNAHQVARAESKKQSLANHERIRFLQASATALPFENEVFDVVFALESAFHFRTRDQFFKEAYRVLKPKGRLIMVDLAGVEKKMNLKTKLSNFLGRSFWQIPHENIYPIQQFKDRLQKTGFQAIEAQSIWQQVHPPFVKFAQSQLNKPEIKKRLNPVFHRLLKASVQLRPQLSPNAMDYVLVYASK